MPRLPKFKRSERKGVPEQSSAPSSPTPAPNEARGAGFLGFFERGFKSTSCSPSPRPPSPASPEVAAARLGQSEQRSSKRSKETHEVVVTVPTGIHNLQEVSSGPTKLAPEEEERKVIVAASGGVDEDHEAEVEQGRNEHWQQQTTPHRLDKKGGDKGLWDQAYDKLPDELKQHLVVDKIQTLKAVLKTAMDVKEANIANQLKLKWRDKEIDVQATADRLVSWVTKFKEVGDIVVQYDPVHAALPWAGVRFILLLVVGDREKLAAATAGMERVAVAIGRCAIYEQLYLTDDIPKNAIEATENLRKGLLALYTTILQALCRLTRVFQGKLIDKLKTPEATWVEIQAIDEPESAVNSTVVAVENCYNSATREHTKGELHTLREQLRELLKGFIPVISRIDRNVEEIYRDVEENKRITILRWFSTVPYQGHHDLAREGRVEHTGAWLFERKEFTSWENSRSPTILWLHGIPGAGKTKLVSATIDYLNCNGRVHFDKVAYFYCKRDEADRRDRVKILLSLIKQLACPPIAMGMDQTTGYSRICTQALEAYNREHQDPSSRQHLNFNSSLSLLGQLVESYKNPVVVLDALDECSEEVRGDLLPGLLSILSKAKRPLKVFISSRHNLDIEDYLQDMPHVCIEARDNAQDIENYVQQELNVATQKKKLLRGNVSHELRNFVEEVILRDANGMFLWVDWQLRELCKLMRESDIRARLGKLPKGLSGVYDEIINSIKSQPDCNFELAMRALQWMLVSERPLTPTELVAAAELNPSIPVDSSIPFQRSVLAVELLIQSCAGLLLLDTTLNVIRFSHLSAQEYLETRSEAWGPSIIDAHLFVSESCLWTLQASLDLPLYDYAARNWFKHCRAYQDLVLSAVNTKGTKHTLSIRLLDSFMGAFELASASYARWLDWVDNNIRTSDLIFLRSIPLCPAFSAAFAGLGELVSWLWHSKGNNMKTQNEYGDSLLAVASRHGTSWIVAKVLNGGCEMSDIQIALNGACMVGNFTIFRLLLDQGVDINVPVAYSATNSSWIYTGTLDTALGAAAFGGNVVMVTHLLDLGADVHIPSSKYGTALGAAAFKGNLEVVTLLFDRGADVNIPGGEYGSALGAAASSYRGGLDIIAFLLDRGADVNLAGGGRYGSALGAAAYQENSKMVTLLLDRGADVNITGGEYGTALGAAAFRGYLEIVTLLLDRGADVNITGGEYGTAVGAAAIRGNLEMVTLLLDRGADVSITSGEYGTAVGAAAFRGNLKIVALLLDRGADANIPGGEYGTALGAAAYGGHLEIVRLLLSRGANPGLTNHDCPRPSSLAKQMGHQDIVDFLDSKCVQTKPNEPADNVQLDLVEIPA